MIEKILLLRALWALAIIAGGLAMYWLVNRWVLFRAQNNSAANGTESLLPHDGTPTILYFTTPGCTACKAVQRPALQRIQERLGEHLQIIEVNAEEQPDLAGRWGVLSVPTTFIIDAAGQVRHVNHGVARVEKLLHQLERIHVDAA
jgi:thiol-disulfide isomerase/thioredoxin